MERGRHPIEIDLKKVTELSALGLTQSQISAALAVSQRTLSRRLADDESFALAYALGQSKLVAEISNLIIEAARQGSLDAMKFILSRRCGWSNNAKLDATYASAPMLTIRMLGVNTAPEIEQLGDDPS